MKVRVHTARFMATFHFGLFINVSNLSETVDREITHVWLDTTPQIYAANDQRPLPKRLKPQETWETWINYEKLPSGIDNSQFSRLVRVRFSTGDVLHGIENIDVPGIGQIPGGSGLLAADNASESKPAVSDKMRPWWRPW